MSAHDAVVADLLGLTKKLLDSVMAGDWKTYRDLVADGGRAVVHCHMGINRGPSMAFALLLADGWGITEALDAIAEARPIVGLIYADDAVRWWGRRNGWSQEQVHAGVAEVSRWHLTKGIDIAQVIRVIRQATRTELG